MTIVDRTTLLKGPAYLTYDAAVIKFAADFTVELVGEKFDLTGISHGRIGRRVKDRRIEIRGTPLEWTDLGKLFPYATTQPQDRIYGAADKSAVITPRNGAPLTIPNVAVTKMPGITLHPSKSILRDMQWTGLVAKNANPALQASYYSFGEAASGVAQTAANLANIPNAFYSALFNGSTYKPEDGFDIDFDLGLEPDFQDGLTIGMRLTALEAAVKFRPISLTEVQYAALMGWDTFQPGDDEFSGDMVISGDKAGKPTVTLSKMQVQAGGVNYGRETRTGDVTLASVRQVSAGALTALWAFGTVAP